MPSPVCRRPLPTLGPPVRNSIPTAHRLAILVACFVVAGCTDWQGEGGAEGPALVGGAQAGKPVGGSDRTLPDGGPTWIETWQAPAAEVAPSGGAETSATPDSGFAQDSATSADAVSADAGSADGAQLETQGDAGPAEVVIILPDGGLPPDDAQQDAGVNDTGGADSQPADTGPDQTTPYTFDGKADFAGWPELPPAPDAKADVGPLDSDPGSDAAADAGTEPGDGIVQPEDGEPAIDALPPIDSLPPVDVVTPDDSITPPDAVVVDVVPGDTALEDTSPVDAGSVDGGPVDTAVVDGGALDTGVADVSAPDGSVADTTVTDAGSADTGLPDVTQTDSGSDSGSGELTVVDGLVVPDWQGYPPDLPYAADADIYGGPIGSCLSLWLYQNESCGDVHPTSECINSAAKDGSLYSQFLFEPLRDCETAVCTSLCAKATDKSCMEGCVGKYCTSQFLACTSNAAAGSDTCANTWTCSQQYKDKLLTISAKCYANASFPEQKNFANILSCVSQPQTKSCLPDIATCFAGPTPGVETCSNTLICIDNCKNNESCGFACMGKGTPKAVSLLDAIWSCQIEKCQPKCAGSPDPKCSDNCLQSDCKDQLVQCLID